jgi:hypothetical protein
MKNEYHIRLPKNTEEREKAIIYLSDHMFQKHGGHPPKETTPFHLFIALDGDTVVGSVGIEFGTSDKQLPFEYLYDFDATVLPVRYTREKTIYYSRWNASRKDLGPPLWLAATEYALLRGIEHGVAITKTPMIIHCKNVLGFEWQVAKNATINPSHIGEHEKEYFFSLNPPLLCFGILSVDVIEMRTLVQQICEKQRIIVEI